MFQVVLGKLKLGVRKRRNKIAAENTPQGRPAVEIAVPWLNKLAIDSEHACRYSRVRYTNYKTWMGSANPVSRE
jgi:hypothetical protein